MTNFELIATGIVIFAARILDVSIGTLRVIVTVQGRTRLAFILGFVEVSIWITVVSTVITNIQSSPLLALFFALGFATGNAVGIVVERKIGLGLAGLRIFTRIGAGRSMAEGIRLLGQAVTTFSGEGRDGPVTELYLVAPRRRLAKILSIIEREDPDAFYVTESARDARHALRPALVQPAGLRWAMKRK